MRLLFIKKITLRLLITIFSIIPIEAFAFDMQIGGWREFKFGTDWSDATGQLKQVCQTYDDAFSDDVFGYTCGSWLGINVDVRIIASEGSFLGFGKTLNALVISTPMNVAAANKINNYLRNNFELTREYKCISETEETRHCSIIFKNGAVVFDDYKFFPQSERMIGVTIRPYELYDEGVFD